MDISDCFRKNIILYAAYGTLAYIFIFLAEAYFEIFSPATDITIIYAADIVLGVIVYAGWTEAGGRFRNQQLYSVSLAALILVPASSIISLVIMLTTETFPFLFILVSGFIMGAILIVFGSAILRMQGKFGDLAKAVGILNVVTGACILTYLLLPLAVLLVPPLSALESLFLFRAYGKLAKPVERRMKVKAPKKRRRGKRK